MDCLNDSCSIGNFLGAYFIYIAILLIIDMVLSWKINTKAGKPGWTGIIPIYDVIVLLDIINKPVWWLFMLIIPGVNIVFGILIFIELAKCFGKGTGFAVGMIFLPIIFLPILAFGSAEYQAPVVETPQD